MFILYTKEGCQYCEKVKNSFLERGVQYEERNISNPEFLNEAKEKGARTMPFLVDTQANVAMGESDDIIEYSKEHSF